MDSFKEISLRGRMAYLICSFEKLLLHFNCKKEEWKGVLEKLWTYTSVDFFDDWMYELAEYMPNSILEDTMDDAEYITEEEFEYLGRIYGKSSKEILMFLTLIYECGTCDIYSRLCEYSPNTLKKLSQAIEILDVNNIALVDIEPFEKYQYSDCDGWGEKFNGKDLSVFL